MSPHEKQHAICAGHGSEPAVPGYGRAACHAEILIATVITVTTMLLRNHAQLLITQHQTGLVILEMIHTTFQRYDASCLNSVDQLVKFCLHLVVHQQK